MYILKILGETTLKIFNRFVKIFDSIHNLIIEIFGTIPTADIGQYILKLHICRINIHVRLTEFVFMTAIIILQKTIQFDIYIVKPFVLLVDNLLEVILKRIFIIIAVIIVVLLVIIFIRELADVLLN